MIINSDMDHLKRKKDIGCPIIIPKIQRTLIFTCEHALRVHVYILEAN
jgi:hypothetical protein